MQNFSLEVMLDHRRRFIEVLSRHYPIPTSWLRQYADVWDWEALSQNTALAWDEALLDEHIDRWKWSRGRVLSCNTGLPWSASLIRKYVDLGKWEWNDLQWQPKVFESAEMVALCLPHWSATESRAHPSDLDAGSYRYFQFTPWGADADRWAPSVVASSPRLQWRPFSAVQGFPWSAEFIEAHADKLDWRRLSFNSGLPWSIDFIRRFEDRWDWRLISSHLPWSIELLEAFEHRFDWDPLCARDRVPWTEAWIDRFAAKVSWARPGYQDGGWDGYVEGLLNHSGFRWTPETFARHRAHVEAHFRGLAEQDEELEGLATEYWTYHCNTSNWTPEFVQLLLELERTGEIDRPTIDWGHLCAHASGIWTPEFIAAHRERIDCGALANNPHFPWAERVDEFADQLSEWDWRTLSSNKNFKPSASTLLRHAARWHWPSLSRHTRASIDALLAVVERLDMEELANNEHLERSAVAALREHWTPRAWRLLSGRKFVSLADAETELPWCWDVLIERMQVEQLSGLDEATVHCFLSTLVEDRQAAPRNVDLESAIARDLERRDNYEVYADWLAERGDPHASLIRSMLDPSEPFDVREFGTRRMYFSSRNLPHVDAYERFIEFKRVGVLWRRGFVRAVWGQQEDWRRLPSLRAFRFLEVLQLGDHLDPPVDDAALELLRPLDRLAKFAVQNSRIYKPTALANLPALTDLRLSHSTLTDLSPLAGLQQLRRLSVWNTNVHDLGPLAELPNLRWLHVGHGPVRDLSPLRACRSLVELDLRFTSVQDLSPLRELSSLRRIFVENTAVDEAQIHMLRQALPALEFCNYTEFWRAVGDVGPFFASSDC